MKTLDAGLLASQTLCYCLQVVRTDGVVALFTSADSPVTVNTGDPDFDGTYESATGLDVSDLVAQASLAVDNLEIIVHPDEATYPGVDILAGRWDGAEFRLFETDYVDPTNVNPLKRGRTGEADTLRATNRFEFRGLKQALQQQLGSVTSKTCRYRFGSQSMPDGLCMLDLHEFRTTYLITAVASKRQFTCGAAAEAADYYKEGTALAVDGANENFSQKVRSFSAGVVTLALPMPYALQIGDAIELTAGCQKRLIEDCKTKFNNVLNFGGEPDVPGADILTGDPETSG